MSRAFAFLTLLVCLPYGGLLAQTTQLDECAVPEAIQAYDDGVDTYMRVMVPHTSRDTTDLRDAADLLRRAAELDVGCSYGLSTVALIHQMLGEPEVAVEALNSALDHFPHFAEGIGYIRVAQGRYEEAKDAYIHALVYTEEVMAESSNEHWNEEIVAAWIRLVWLARSPAASLAAADQLPNEIASLPRVTQSVCLARRVDPIHYGRYYGHAGDPTNLPTPSPLAKCITDES